MAQIVVEKVGKEAPSLNDYKPIYAKIKGKVAIIFGKSFAGKTTLAHVLTNFFKKTLYIAVDKNFDPEFFKEIASNVEYRRVYSVQQFKGVIRSLQNENNHDYIVIDSITSVASYILQGDPSPRKYNQLNSLYDWVFGVLSNLKPKVTSVIIAHDKLKDFESQETVPKMSINSLRHVDVVLRIADNYEIQLFRERKPVKMPVFSIRL